MANIQDYDLCDTFNIERKLLLYCGIYPNERRLNKFLYVASAFYHIALSLLITISMIIYVTMNMENILSIAEILLFLVTQTSFLCKMFNILLKKQQLLKIEDILSNQAFYKCSKNKIATIDSYVRSTKVFGVIYRSICCVVCTSYAIFPLLTEEKWALPFLGWYPFDIDTKFKYLLIYAFQCISYFISAYLNSCIDILIYMLFTVATAQFEVLKDNLSNIKYDTEGANDDFANNVILHYEILRLLVAIEDTFSYGTLIQFFSSVIVICFTEFEILIVSPNSIQFVSIFMYFNCMTFQVAMYCWFGHNIIASSDNINEALYMSNWYESEYSLKKSILIFMERCRKPVVLTAGKLFPLSLLTFTSLMRSSYSYFAVLQRLYGPE